MNRELTRRDFLVATGSTVALALLHLRCGDGGRPVEMGADPIREAPRAIEYSGFGDLYRKQWTWDRVTKGTHYANCGYQRCAWNVYVKDGIVWREEQVATYEPTNADLPDFNPRGCQKGACYSDRMYDQSRLTTPLKRVGARGEGKWKRISWEQALSEIAGGFIEAITSEQHGPGSIYWDLGSSSSNGCHALGLTRSAYLLDTPILENTAEMGDHAPGVATTTGKVIFTSSMDDLFYSDLILIWGGNPELHAHPERALHLRGALQGRPRRLRRARLQPLVDPRRRMGAGQHRNRRRAGALDGAGHRRREAPQARIHGRADRHAAARTRWTSALPARERPEADGADDGSTCSTASRNASSRRLGAAWNSGRRARTGGRLRGRDARRHDQGHDGLRALKARLADYTAGADRSDHRRQGQPGARARKTHRPRQCLLQHLADQLRKVLPRSGDGAEHPARVRPGRSLRETGAGYAAVPMLSISGVDPFTPANGKYAPKIAIGLVALKAAPEMLRLKLAGYSDEMIVYHFARQDYAWETSWHGAVPLPARRPEGALRRRQALGPRSQARVRGLPPRGGREGVAVRTKDPAAHPVQRRWQHRSAASAATTS